MKLTQVSYFNFTSQNIYNNIVGKSYKKNNDIYWIKKYVIVVVIYYYSHIIFLKSSIIQTWIIKFHYLNEYEF